MSRDIALNLALACVSQRRRRERNIIKKVGFTLIELAISLVIIGLLVGGLLEGQSLIKAAEIRAQIGQYEKYGAAMNTFKTKYNAMPGDMLSSEASAFGLFVATLNPSDGNGIISLDSNGYLTAEQFIFWRHLTEAKLIEGSYSPTGTTAGTISPLFGLPLVVPTNHKMINAHFPEGKIGKGTSIHIGSYNSGPHYFTLTGINALTTGGSALVLLFTGSTSPLTAQEAYAMDSKIDDGLPSTGSVLADYPVNNGTPLPGYIFTPNANCATATAYALNPGSTPACSMQFKIK